MIRMCPNDGYLAWERIRDSAEPDRRALADLRSGRHWSFGDLQAEVDALPALEPGTLICPRGFSVDLVFQTLRAWRDGAVLCPVERERDRPDPGIVTGLPRGVCHLKLTSGSTEKARMVMFTAESLAADARKIVSTMGLRREWPNLGVISMAHSYGFSNLVLPLLWHGIPLAWLGDPMPGAVAKVWAAPPDGGEGWTVPAVPALWRLWQEAGALVDSRIRLAISAGAPLPVEWERAIFDSVGMKIHNFYGSSECGGIAFDGSGVPRACGDVAGEAMDETFLSVDGHGCLEVRSPSVGLGYWPGGEGVERLGQGFFRTSDLVSLGGGTAVSVTLLGRSDDLINVAGRKVPPARVEAAIGSLTGVRQVLVFGIPSADAVRGEEIVAVVNWSGGEADDAAFRLQMRAIDGSLEPHERPRHWWLCDDLAPDVRGKIPRHRWRERFLEKRDRP